MKTLLRISLCALGVMIAGTVAAQPPDPYPDWAPLPVDLKNDVVRRARLELETHRAGGPRREVVRGILLAGRTDDAAWSGEVTFACLQGQIDCAEFEPLVHPLAGKLTGDWRRAVEHDLSVLNREAYVNSLPASARHDAYRQRLMGTPPIDPNLGWLNASAAALRALREGFDDLIPLIRANLGGSLESNRTSIERALRVRRAVISSNPGRALLKLVREGVEWDIKRSLATPDEMKKHKYGDETPFQVAGQALVELERLNPSGAAEGLKDCLEMYEPVARRMEAEREAAEARSGLIGAGTPEKQPARKYLVGWISGQILTVIGNLGDREFVRNVYSRELPGYMTPWDRVEQLEKELVKRGELKASEMVCGPAE